MNPQTPTEAFVIAQAQPLLSPGEVVLGLGYLPPSMRRGRVGAFVDAATKMAAFAVLTDRRLLFVRTRIGAFSPLLENHGVEAIDRVAVRGVYVGDELYFELGDGRLITYQAKSSVRQVPSQQAFLRLLEESFPRSEQAAQRSASRIQTRYVAFAVGVLIALAYTWLHLRHR